MRDGRGGGGGDGGGVRIGAAAGSVPASDRTDRGCEKGMPSGRALTFLLCLVRCHCLSVCVDLVVPRLVRCGG